MSSSCVSQARLTAFLAGQLDADDDRVVAEHLDGCSRCEALAAELSDDREARKLAAAAEGKQPVAAKLEPQVEDLCRRIQALGLYELAAQKEIHDTQSVIGHSPTPTAVLKQKLKQQAIGLTAALPVAPPKADEPPPLSPPAEGVPRLKRLGRYDIVRLLGSGTFGVVYLAHDCKLHRPVALKIARATVLADDHLRLRFVREAETLAMLQHPHIVPVYEADEVEGLCYLAIAFCDGPTLEQYLQESGPLDPRLAVKLLLPLVDAVEHAHAHGVLHRDIKPANVILEKAEGKCDGLDLVPRLTDFGLAKVVEEKSTSTLSGIVLGTAQYMAPEQAAGHIERIGPPTDVYALGAVLYQMLTGRAPIEGNTTIDTLRRLLIDDPLEVRRLAPGVPADLDAIVLRCLNKAVTARYATAADLAADLRRFLDGQQTVARPLSIRQRASRWIHRNPTLTSLLALTAIVLALSLSLYRSSQQLWRSLAANQQTTSDLEASQRQAELAKHEVRLRDYCDHIQKAKAAIDAGDMAKAIKALQNEIPTADDESPVDLRGLAWYYLWDLATQVPLHQVKTSDDNYQICLSPDQRELAAVGKDSTLRLYDATNLKQSTFISTNQIEINGVAYSPDGQLIATAGDDGTIRVFDLHSREQLHKFDSHNGKVFGVTFYDGSSKLASCGNEPLVRLWDVSSGDGVGYLEGHTDFVEALALSPDGRLLATASSDKTCILWNLNELQPEVKPLGGHNGKLSSVCFSPKGDWLATGGLDKTVILWDASSGKRLGTQTHLDGVQTVAFSSSGQHLFAGDRSGALRKYRIEPGKPNFKLALDNQSDTWLAHDNRVWYAIANPKTGTLLTSGGGGWLRIWSAGSRSDLRQVVPSEPTDVIVDLAYSPDGERLFLLHEHSGIEMLDAHTLRSLGNLHSRHMHWHSLAVLGDEEVAAGNAHGVVAIWNWKTGELNRVIDPPHENYTVTGIIYSPQTKLIGVLPYDANHVRIYHAKDREFAVQLQTSNHSSAAFSPDGERLAVDTDNNIFIYDVGTQRLVQTLHGHGATISSLAYNAEGLLASASSDRSLRLWSPDGKEIPFGTEHLAPLAGAAFTPDNRTLVSFDEAGVLRLIQPAADRRLLDIPTETTCLRALALAPDSRRLAVLRDDHSILVIGTAGPP